MQTSQHGRSRLAQPSYLGPSGLTGLSSRSVQGPGYTPHSLQATPRYREYSSSRFSEVTSYPTPVNYSSRSLRRGNSLEPTPSPPTPASYSSSSLSRSSTPRTPRLSSELLTDYLNSSSRLSLNRELPAQPHQREVVKRQSSVEARSFRDQRDHRDHRDPRDHTQRFTPREKLESFRNQPYREKQRPISCDKVYNGIHIGNGETILNIAHLKAHGITHVLNTAEQHVEVSPGAYSLNKIQYYGFHVDDLPHCNISRHFRRTTDFINRAVESGGDVVVNCYMGLSRSATCVMAYLMMKKNMTCQQALDTISQGRKVRPNPGFLQQLKELEHSLRLSGRFAR